MTSYRISKYNPANRDNKGSYLDDIEWTAISHINKKEYNYLTYNEYKKIEDDYVGAIKIILSEKKIDFLNVASVEFCNDRASFAEYNNNETLKDLNVNFEDVQNLQNGTQVPLNKVSELIRLILREVV